MVFDRSRCTLKVLGALVLAGALLALPSVARASIMIDDFSDSNPAVWPFVRSTVDTTPYPHVVETGLTNVLGGVRDTDLAATFIGHVGLDHVALTVFTGDEASILDYSTDARAKGLVGLNYGSLASGGPALGLNLSQAGAVQIYLLDYDAPGSQALNYGVDFDTPAGLVSLTGSTSTPGEQALLLGFGSLAPSLTTVNGLHVWFQPPKAADFQVESITTTGNLLVPEPATMALLGFGCVAIFVRRQRKA